MTYEVQSDPFVRYYAEKYGLALQAIQPGFDEKLATKGMELLQELSMSYFNPSLVGHPVTKDTLRNLVDQIVQTYVDNDAYSIPFHRYGAQYQYNDNEQALPTFKYEMQALLNMWSPKGWPTIPDAAADLLEHLRIEYINAFWVLGPAGGWHL
jgi:hypothetical protein